MAIINCSECKREISDKAFSCPSCGNPINQSSIQVTTDPNKPIKIEPQLTSKRWKLSKIISGTIILVGFLLTFSGEPSFNRASFGIGFLLMLIGAIILIISQIGAWYSDRQAR